MRITRLSLLIVTLTGLLPVASCVRAAEAEPTTSVTPGVNYIRVSGDRSQFREDQWIHQDWTGGIEDFTTTQALKNDWIFSAEGRGIIDEDYKLQLQIANPKYGFMRAGFVQFRRYYDDAGGFFRPFTTSAFRLGRDLHLDNGRFFVEAGLTLEDLPKLTLGYERQYRDGTKSLLEWGSVTDASNTRKIYPSFKDIDETVDIIKVTVEHDIKNVHLADQFRYEHNRNDTTRTDTSMNLITATARPVTIREEYRQDAFFNTFRMDSHLNEKVYWSMGYLFSSLNGEAALAIVTPPPLSAFDKNWLARAFEIDSESHVLNVNALVGPFAGLSLYAGLQAERTDSDGGTGALLTEGLMPASTNTIRSSNDKRSLEETAGLRFTKIPFTTLYAEAKWTQQDIDLLEAELANSAVSLQRDTDTSVSRQDYRVGFNTAPLPRLTLAGSYRHKIYNNDYDHDTDTVIGYPAFITGQEFTTDELMGKLTLRPCRQFNVSFKYQWVTTDIETETDSIFSVTPGGSLTSGKYDAMIYTVSATVTPISRLYLTGLFSLQDTHTRAFDNSAPEVLSYVGNVYTVMGSAGYALDEKTDVTVQYTYSAADNFRNNAPDGLPLGLDNRRHAVLAGISRKLNEHIIARLRYGYFENSESSTGGLHNYRAHLASASCTVLF